MIEWFETGSDAVQIGVVVQPHHAEYRQIRDAWMRAEALGVDTVFVWDHFFSPFEPSDTKHFECWSLLAAMAEVTTRVRIGPLVSCSAYRNSNLIADLARTVDHISGGRLVLGLGPGWYEPDFLEYGFEFGSWASRLAQFEAALQVIRARLSKLIPPALQDPLPLMIGSKGAKVGLRIVAEYANIWHAPADYAECQRLSSILDDWCRRRDRDPATIERWTSIDSHEPLALADDYRALGFSQLIVDVTGPGYDYGRLAELLAWRDSLTD